MVAEDARAAHVMLECEMRRLDKLTTRIDRRIAAGERLRAREMNDAAD
jgi:hypothetical protein